MKKSAALAVAVMLGFLVGGASANSPLTRSSAAAPGESATSHWGTDATEPIIRVAGYRLYPAPADMRAKCLRAKPVVRFPVLCPTVLPRAKDGTKPRTYVDWADSHEGATRADWLYAGASYSGSSDPEHWEWNNPDFFLHFFVEQGRLTPRLLDLTGTRYPQKLLGTRTLGGHHGKLYEQVSYAVCGCGFGGHYTFVWRQNGVKYAASLHRWLPKPTLRVLEALILHLKPV